MRRHAKASSAGSSRVTTNSRGLFRLPLVLVAALWALALIPASASAAQALLPDGQFFSSGGSDPGQISNPAHAAVEQSTGNLFVADTGNGRIDVFKADGSFLTSFGEAQLDSPFGIAIAESGGQTQVYVSDSATKKIVRFNSDEAATPTFTLDGTFTSPAEGTGPDKVGNFAAPLAVAPNGDLWVADPGDNRLQRYDATGAYTGSSFDGSTAPAGPFPGGPFTGLLDVAVDSTGRLYIVDSTAPIYEGPNGGGGGQSRVERFAPDGTYQLTLAGLNRPSALAVDPATGQVAVATEPGAFEPSVHLFDSSGVELSSIGLGDQSAYNSARGLAFAAATSRIWVVEGVTYSTGSPVGHEDIKRLRVVTLPEATVAAPASVSYASANFSGTVDPEGNTTTARFEVSSDAGANWTPLAQFPVCEVTAPGQCEGGPQPVSFSASGLTPATEYRVRLRALVGGGTASSVSPGTQTFTTLPVGAPGILIAAPSAVTGGSAHFSGTINPEAPEGAPTSAAVEAGFKVEWHFECTPECPGLTGGTVAADNSPHAVSADTTGLKPGTAYQVKLVAENAGGPTSPGPKGFTTLVVVASVQSTDANPLISEAHLRALINPEGGATDFHFEYGLTTAYGQSTPTETIPAGIELVTARSTVVGLAQGTTYHYRVVATNSAGPVQGPDQTFTTQSAPGPENCPNAAVRAEQGVTYLGECRAFEMVSPLDKGGAGLYANYQQDGYHGGFANGASQMSSDGNSMLFSIPSGALSGSRSAPGFARYESFRSGGDWSTKPIDPAIDPYPSYLRPWLTFAGSDDGTKAVVFSNKALAPGGVDSGAQGGNIYLYDISNDSYELIASSPDLENWSELSINPVLSVTPDLGAVVFSSGAALIPGDPEGGTYEWREGLGLRKLAINADGTPMVGGGGPNPISSDGKRVLFGGPGAGLYLREDGKPPIQVTASQRTGDDPAQPQPFTYQGASKDLSKIYFYSGAALTNASASGAESYYQYDLATGKLTDLLAGVGPADRGLSSNFTFVSADGSSFVATASGAFAPGATPNTPHVYLWRNGHIQLIATTDQLSYDGARLSSNGRYIAMVLKAKLTSYDNRGPGCEQSGGGADPNLFCAEVYVYDADTETLRCASCQPDGEAPKGYALFSFSQVPGLLHETYALSDDGKVAFESSDALVPRDVNEKRDIYTWQNGHVELISSGTGHDDAHFVDMSQDGSTIAFVTAQRLVGRDVDNLQDAYVSRVDGGLVSQGAPPPPATACDSSDQCRGAATTAPSPSKGGSESFESAEARGGRSTVSIVHNRGATAGQGALQVAVSGAGKIVVSGSGAKRTTKKVAKRGTYAVKVKLQGAALKKLHAKGKVTVKVKVQFLPQAGSASTTNAQLTFKQGNSKGGK